MSKYSDSFEEKLQNIRKVKEETKHILNRDGKLAMESIHDSKSLKKLKDIIKNK